MMRLPDFRYHAPTSVREAAAILSGEGPAAMLLAGGTDLLPNMKRRQQVPSVLVGLRQIVALSSVRRDGEVSLGAGLTLADLVSDSALKTSHPALWQAAAQVATPHLRNMGTLGGNLCLDTRCNYYDQNYEWRKAIGYCMKKDGDICWVATSSPRCLAASSTDTAPALIALGTRVRLVSSSGERTIPLADLYADDGIQYLTKRPEEILTEVLLPPAGDWRSAYWKLRRRGSFDFPVLSVAAAARLGAEGVVEEARLVLGSVAPRPVEAQDAAALLRGRRLTDEAIEAASQAATRRAKPMDNTDFTLHWRKRVVTAFVRCALRELRGDDLRGERARFARRELSESA